MATTVNLSAYSGSVSGTNWGPAFIAAFTAIKTTGGTVNIDVDCQVESQMAIGDISGLVSYCPFRVTSDTGVTVTIKFPDWIVFHMNGNQIETFFNNICFIGNTESTVGQPTYTTCANALYVTPAVQSVVEKCVFAGIAATDAVILAINGPLVIRDSAFSGCGAGTAIIYANEAESLIMENCTFNDYQNLRGVYYNKQGYPPYWIKAVYTGTPITSHVPLVHLKNVRTDEGTSFCYIEGYPRVIIEQCASNLNGASGQGIYLKDVDHAIINQYWAGYPVQDNPAIKLENCGYVIIDGLQIQNGINRIVIDAATDFVQITNSPGVIVDAAAGAKYSFDGVTYKGTVKQVG